MSWSQRVGFARYLQVIGQSYAEMFRSGVQGGSVVAGVAAYLGLSPRGAIAVGIAAFVVFQSFAVLAGYVVFKWRVIHATLTHDGENNPIVMRQFELLGDIACLLKEVEMNTRPRGTLLQPPRAVHRLENHESAARGL